MVSDRLMVKIRSPGEPGCNSANAAEPARPENQRPVIENKVPTAMETADFWPVCDDLYLDFANCCFSNDDQRSKFVEKHCRGGDTIFLGAWSPDSPGHETMLAVQEELLEVMRAYAESHEAFSTGQAYTTKAEFYPLHYLNKWLGRLSPMVMPYPIFPDEEKQRNFDSPYLSDKMLITKRNDQGEILAAHTVFSDDEIPEGADVMDSPPRWYWRMRREYENAKWGLRTMPWPRNERNSRYGLLFLQFAEDVLTNGQDMKQCPNHRCSRYFVPKDREGADQTCGRPACRKWASKKRRQT
jgi:hypothetical protein